MGLQSWQMSRVDVELNAKNNCGETALFDAVAYCQISIVKLLLECIDIYVNLKTRDGSTVLPRAAAEVLEDALDGSQPVRFRGARHVDVRCFGEPKVGGKGVKTPKHECVVLV